MKNIKHKYLKVFLIFLWVILGISITFSLIIYLTINPKIKKATEEANLFLENFPKTSTNETANNLDLMLLDFGLLPVNHSLQTEIKQDKELENINHQLTSFLEKTLESSEINPQPVPENLQNFLVQNQDQIREIRDYILTSDLPTWTYKLEEIFNNPIHYQIPQLSGILILQKIFLTQILANQDNLAEINKTLEASFKLNQATQYQPDLIGQLVSINVGQYQAGVLRQLEKIDPQWLDKIKQYDYNYRQGILDALYLEALRIGSPFQVESSDNNLIFDWLGKPYLQFIIIDTGKRMTEAFNQLENQNVCNFDLKQVEEKLKQAPKWNIFSDMLPNFSNQWRKGDGVLLDFELTQQILELKDLKQETGQYPDSLPNPKSEVCPTQQWQYQKDNNKITVNFSQELDWKIPQDGDNILIIPLRFYLND
jgi:hypothetical protein